MLTFLDMWDERWKLRVLARSPRPSLNPAFILGAHLQTSFLLKTHVGSQRRREGLFCMYILTHTCMYLLAYACMAYMAEPRIDKLLQCNLRQGDVPLRHGGLAGPPLSIVRLSVWKWRRLLSCLERSKTLRIQVPNDTSYLPNIITTLPNIPNITTLQLLISGTWDRQGHGCPNYPGRYMFGACRMKL